MKEVDIHTVIIQLIHYKPEICYNAKVWVVHMIITCSGKSGRASVKAEG
jgi:hypothetical protein